MASYAAQVTRMMLIQVKIEDNLNLSWNKDILIYQGIENNTLFSGNGRRLEFSENWKPLQYQLMSNVKTICSPINLEMA